MASLTDWLYHIRNKEPPVFSNADADRVIRLLNSLTLFDQASSKFNAPKSTRVSLEPGVQSMKR